MAAPSAADAFVPWSCSAAPCNHLPILRISTAIWYRRPKGRKTRSSAGRSAASWMNRRYLNLIVHDFRTRVYSLCRIDACKHLFYRDSEIAQRAALAARESKSKRWEMAALGGWRNLPPPAINFQPSPSWRNSNLYYMFSLLGGESTILYADNRGNAALYDVDLKFVDAFPSPNSEKRGSPICLPAIQADPIDPRKDAQSLYVLDLSSTARNNCCFEVLSYRREEWCWDLLPPPPFFRDPEAAPGVYSYAVIDGGSIICISSLEEPIGTYTFDTVSATWRRAADWALPFFGRAEYVPDLGLWVGLSGSSPSSSLCAFDLSAIDAARPPVPRHAWDYLDLPEAEPWTPSQLHLLNLGSGRFCVASFFGTMLRTYGRSKSPHYHDPDEEEEDDTFGRECVVFTGMEVKRGRGNGGEAPLQLIKHMSKRFTTGSLNIECVL